MSNCRRRRRDQQQQEEKTRVSQNRVDWRMNDDEDDILSPPFGRSKRKTCEQREREKESEREGAQLGMRRSTTESFTSRLHLSLTRRREIHSVYATERHNEQRSEIRTRHNRSGNSVSDTSATVARTEFIPSAEVRVTARTIVAVGCFCMLENNSNVCTSH